MESISKIIKDLMISDAYYGLFACSLNRKWDDKLKTAGICTDGINFELHINKDFWEKLSYNERYGVIKHELLHLVFFHVVNMQDYLLKSGDFKLMNIAMDLEVQSYIDKKYWGDPNKYVATSIFNAHPELPMKQGTLYYIDFLKKINETQEGQGMNFKDQYCNDHHLSPNEVSEIKKMFELNTMDDHKSFSQNEDKKNLLTTQLEWQMKEAYEQLKKSRGEIPGELRDKLESLLTIKPSVFNWKAYFRRMLGFAYDIYYKKTRRKESNRFTDAYGLKHNKKHSMLIAIDTSGSVSQEELEDFFSEIYHIWKAGADIDIIECDTRITNQYKYKGKIPKYISGRGGTSFLPCIEYYNNNYNKYTTMVYFTDGYGDQESCKPVKKMIWVITSCGYQEGKYPGYKICIPKTN